MMGALDYQFDAALVEPGLLTITASAADDVIVDDGAVAGNISVESITVTVPPHEPQVSFVSPVNGEGVFWRMPVQASAESLIGKNIEEISFFVNGELVGTDDSDPFEVTVDFSRFSGTVQLNAQAVDEIDNVGSSTVSVGVVPLPNLRFARWMEAADIGDAEYQVGDVDGDGTPDIVYGGAALTFANGLVADGDWYPRQTFEIDSVAVNDLVLIDFDGDFDLDILAITNDTLNTYINNGNGFDPPQTVTFDAGNLSHMAVGDLNGDAAVDVVVGRDVTGDEGEPEVVIFTQGAGMNFTQTSVLNGAGNVSDIKLFNVDPVNGDTDLDIIVGRTGNDRITTYRNFGVGNFGAGQDSFTTGEPAFITLGDFNGDDFPDVAALIPAATFCRFSSGYRQRRGHSFWMPLWTLSNPKRC